jgi:hypothetical protein
MRKLIFSVSMLLSVSNAFSQWMTKAVDNGLDNPYKIAYCDSKQTDTFYAKLEKTSKGTAFYVSGGYFCEDAILVDLAFKVDGEWKKYQFVGYTSSSKKSLFIIDDLTTQTCLEDFKSATDMVMRINDNVCGSDDYTFNMANSTSSYNFVFNQNK